MSVDTVEIEAARPSRVQPSGSLFPRLWDHVWQQPRPVRKAVWWLIPLSALSLLLGTGAIIWDGVIMANPQTRWLAIAVGAVGFYLPGLCFAGAIYGLFRGHLRLVQIGIVVAIVQGLGTFLGFGSMYLTKMYSITSTLAILLWATMAFGAAIRLWQARRWANVSVAGHRGFDVAP